MHKPGIDLRSLIFIGGGEKMNVVKYQLINCTGLRNFFKRDNLICRASDVEIGLFAILAFCYLLMQHLQRSVRSYSAGSLFALYSSVVGS